MHKTFSDVTKKKNDTQIERQKVKHTDWWTESQKYSTDRK